MRLHLAWPILLSLLPLPAAAQPDRSKVLDCRRDEDCGFAVSVCGECAPCQPSWRPVSNRAEIRRIHDIQTRARCARKKCPSCASASWSAGDRAVCRDQRCTPAQLAIGYERRRADVSCKVDSDCAAAPPIRGGCPPCGLQIPRFVSKKHAEALQRAHEKALRESPAPECAKCGSPARSLPGRAACHAGQCLTIPSPVR
jgi:hypothetical protein